MTTNRTRRVVLPLALGCLVLATALPAAPAQAAINPISSGLTTVHLAKPFTETLKHSKVKIAAIAPAKVKGATISLPVVSGSLDSDTAMGAIGESGSIKLKAPHGSAVLRQFSLRTTSTPLYAVVGGAQIKLGNGSGRSLAREGFGSSISFRTMKLTHNFAGRLNTLLHLKVFKQGQPFGSVQSTAQPSTVALAPIRQAHPRPQPPDFRQAGRTPRLGQPGLPGRNLRRGLRLPTHLRRRDLPRRLARHAEKRRLDRTAATRRKNLYLRAARPPRNLAQPRCGRTVSAELEAQPSPPYRGKLGPVAVLGLNMGTATVSSDPAARTIAVSGATATFNATLAATFNEALEQGQGEVFKAGETLGTLSFSVGAE